MSVPLRSIPVQKMYEREDCLLNIKHLCKIAGVSISGYYHYLATADVRDEREEQDRKNVQMIIEAY